MKKTSDTIICVLREPEASTLTKPKVHVGPSTSRAILVFSYRSLEFRSKTDDVLWKYSSNVSSSSSTKKIWNNNLRGEKYKSGQVIVVKRSALTTTLKIESPTIERD
jgi:hypothetical protein